MWGETRAGKGSTSLGRFWWLPQLTSLRRSYDTLGHLFREIYRTPTHTYIHIYDIYDIYMIYDICMKIWHTWKVWVCLSWALRLEGFFVIPKPCCTSGGNAMVSADWLPFCESILSLKDWTSSGDGMGTWNWFRLLGLLVSPWPSSSPGSRYRLAFGRRTPQNGLVWK
jgi:hypothetical protein